LTNPKQPVDATTTIAPIKALPQRKKSARFIGKDISATTYQQIATILLQQQQFNLDGYKNLCIKRRIATQIRAVGCDNTDDYIDILQNDADEQQRLLAALSIHVSQFFRNQSTFAVLEDKILPNLIKIGKQQHRQTFVWSIGCANGEEPYSIALLWHQRRYQKDSLALTATDLSPNAIASARDGVYAENRIGNVPAEMLNKYFTHTDKNYQLDAKIRAQVQFVRHDILVDQPYAQADLILCRNLLIYFSREQQRQVLEILASALVPGGYLVLGRAESLAPACRVLFTCIDPAERIYQRVTAKDETNRRSKTCVLK